MLAVALVAGMMACSNARPRVELSGLSFEPEPEWVVVPPASRFRVAQYRLPWDGAEADLVVFHFGAQGAAKVEDNIARWRSQVRRARKKLDPAKAEVVHEEYGGIVVDWIDLEGTYVAETFPGSGKHHSDPGFRVLAAVVQTPGGPYYVKMVGPESVVDRWSGSFANLLASFQAAPLLSADPGLSHP
jgi:hypothetical protein